MVELLDRIIEELVKVLREKKLKKKILDYKKKLNEERQWED